MCLQTHSHRSSPSKASSRAFSPPAAAPHEAASKSRRKPSRHLCVSWPPLPPRPPSGAAGEPSRSIYRSLSLPTTRPRLATGCHPRELPFQLLDLFLERVDFFLERLVLILETCIGHHALLSRHGHHPCSLRVLFSLARSSSSLASSSFRLTPLLEMSAKIDRSLSQEGAQAVTKRLLSLRNSDSSLDRLEGAPSRRHKRRCRATLHPLERLPHQG